MNNQPAGVPRLSDLPTEVADLIREKLNYEKKLSDLIEKIKTAALGVDYQTKVELRYTEKKVIEKLKDTNEEIRQIIKDAKNMSIHTQGELF